MHDRFATWLTHGTGHNNNHNRVKILFQIQANHLRVNRDGVPKYHGIAQTLRLVVKEEGIVGWYKGNLANVVRVVPVYSLKFALNDEFKRMLRSEPNEKLPIWKMCRVAFAPQLTCRRR